MDAPSAARSRVPHTYMPTSDDRTEIIDFAAFMREVEAYLSSRPGKAALVNPNGQSRPIPSEIFRILEHVADALANGKAVTVAPSGMMLTTQQAADFLGVSRPTLVKLLEQDIIAFERPGRHRRVALRDLVAYRDSFHADREAALDAVARETPQSKTRDFTPDTVIRRVREP